MGSRVVIASYKRGHKNRLAEFKRSTDQSFRLPRIPFAKKYPTPVFLTALIVSIGIHFSPIAKLILFPIVLLGTIIHELGHGLAALMVGGGVNKIVVYKNLGGSAYIQHTGNAWSDAFVSAGGLILPSMIGAAILIASRRWRLHSTALLSLGLLIFITNWLWISNDTGTKWWIYGISGALLFCALLSYSAKAIVAQMVGILLCLQAMSSFGYMMTKTFERNGSVLHSDTHAIALAIGGSYWMYGITLIIVTMVILAFSLRESSV